MTTIIIIAILIALVILYFVFKPYLIKYDTTIAFTGGLGSGKTLNAVKTAVRLYKKTNFQIKIQNIKLKIHNKLFPKKQKQLIEKAKLYSNIPILINKKKNEWSTILTKEHLLLKIKISEYSIVFIDELPQMVNQFNWNLKEVQDNLNEFITFFRHYIGGYFIITAQSIDDVVAQLRRKLNTYYWLYNFRKFLFIFYKCDCMNLQTTEMVITTTTSFIEENTKTIYGILIPKKYDSRCYSIRYTNVNELITEKKYKKLKTKKITRFGNYISPLDTMEKEK